MCCPRTLWQTETMKQDLNHQPFSQFSQPALPPDLQFIARLERTQFLCTCVWPSACIPCIIHALSCHANIMYTYQVWISTVKKQNRKQQVQHKNGAKYLHYSSIFDYLLNVCLQNTEWMTPSELCLPFNSPPPPWKMTSSAKFANGLCIRSLKWWPQWYILKTTPQWYIIIGKLRKTSSLVQREGRQTRLLLHSL